MSSWNIVLATFWCCPLPDDPDYGKNTWNPDRVFGKELVMPNHACDADGFWTHDEKDDKEYTLALDLYLERFKDAKAHPEDYLPMGSEGSCRIAAKKIENPNWIVNVYGKLRDRDPENFAEVRAWFKRVLKKCDVNYAICRVSNRVTGKVEIYQHDN